MNKLTAYDENGRVYDFEIREENGHMFLTLKKEVIRNAKRLFALGDFTAACAGDEGYYIVPRHFKQDGDLQIRFREREDITHLQANPIMSFFGIKRADQTYLVRIERNYNYFLLITVKNGVYRLEIKFEFEENYAPEGYLDAMADTVYDDIRIELIPLGKGADYNDMARVERETRLLREGIETLAERCEKRACVDYARKYPLIRIRMGWKPSPSPVLHQTAGSEPEMYVACDFDRVCDIADELKRQGVKGAELQLVGWNKQGHDGAFPDIFPADERLGGDEGLKKAIDYVKSLGYRISTHTNAMDSTENAETFSWDDSCVLRNGEKYQYGHYSGGLAYRMCYKAQTKHLLRDMPKLAKYGENGLHFSDVISILLPYPCFSKEHPATTKDALEANWANMQYMKELFGGFSSEGCMDFAIKYIDYGLYVTFGSGFGKVDYPIADAFLPVWELTYHGVILYNPSSPTVNYTIKEPKDRLTAVMWGGKPSFYIYSKFRTGGAPNWMGNDDLTTATEEELRHSVCMIRQGAEEFEALSELQLVHLSRYDYLENGIQCATYENGTRVVGNFSTVPASFEGQTIEPYGYLILKA